MADALAYFITFRTYGTWLHGDPRGSVDRWHNLAGSEPAPPNAGFEAHKRSLLKSGAVILDVSGRAAVEQSVCTTCEFRSWTLHAVNARTNHVHVVVTAPGVPIERVMNSLNS